MNKRISQVRPFLAAIFLPASVLSISSCGSQRANHLSQSASGVQTGSAVYAIRNIPEGGMITQEALEERELEYSKIPQDAITASSIIAGRTAKYGIYAGQIVSQHDIAPRSDNHSISVVLTAAQFRRLKQAASMRFSNPNELVGRWISEKLSE